MTDIGPRTSSHRKAWRCVIWLAYALVLALAPLLLDSGLGQSLLSQIGVAIIACLSFNLLLGQGGMLSFGHAVYSGAGGFAAIHVLRHIAMGLPVPVSLVPLLGGLCAALVALVLGWVSTRRAGTAFAMITFGMGELVWAGALMFPALFGGEAGLSANRVVGAPLWGLSWGPQIQVTYLIAAYTWICTLMMYAFTRTPLGRLLNAARDQPERVAFTGHQPQTVRYLAFVMAAFFAGVAGGLAALNFELVSADAFSAYRSGAYLIFSVLGGTGYFFGPILGGILMVLAFVLLSDFSRAWLLYLGLAFVAVVAYAPGGLAAWIVALWQRGRLGPLRPLLWQLLVRLVTALPILLGTMALIEMLYHRQLDAVLGPRLMFLGLSLNTADPRHWLGSIAMVGLGLLTWQWVCRMLPGASHAQAPAGEPLQHPEGRA
jgi:branched-chain amino acid transport system permease protein